MQWITAILKIKITIKINEYILFGTMKPVIGLQLFPVSLREHKWFNDGEYS